MKYPKVTDLDIAFGIVPDKKMVHKATEKGFYNGRTKYNDLFSDIFFSGGTVTFKQGVDKEVIDNAMRYFKSVAVSFGSKHEEKEAVCAMVLSDIAEV